MNVDFPYHFDDSGRTATSGDDDHLRDLIAQVLFTSPGERVMRPDFGCGIHDLAFAAVSTQVVARIETTVRDALRTHEARIDVRRVQVKTAQLDLGRLDVEVDYEVRATNQPGNFVYPFYFQESASR